MTSDAMNCYSHVIFGGNTYPLPIFKSEVEFYKLYALSGQSVTCRYFLSFGDVSFHYFIFLVHACVI